MSLATASECDAYCEFMVLQIVNKLINACVKTNCGWLQWFYAHLSYNSSLFCFSMEHKKAIPIYVTLQKEAVFVLPINFKFSALQAAGIDLISRFPQLWIDCISNLPTSLQKPEWRLTFVQIQLKYFLQYAHTWYVAHLPLAYISFTKEVTRAGACVYGPARGSTNVFWYRTGSIRERIFLPNTTGSQCSWAKGKPSWLSSPRSWGAPLYFQLPGAGRPTIRTAGTRCTYNGWEITQLFKTSWKRLQLYSVHN